MLWEIKTLNGRFTMEKVFFSFRKAIVVDLTGLVDR